MRKIINYIFLVILNIELLIDSVYIDNTFFDRGKYFLTRHLALLFLILGYFFGVALRNEEKLNGLRNHLASYYTNYFIASFIYQFIYLFSATMFKILENECIFRLCLICNIIINVPLLLGINKYDVNTAKNTIVSIYLTCIFFIVFVIVILQGFSAPNLGLIFPSNINSEIDTLIRT